MLVLGVRLSNGGVRALARPRVWRSTNQTRFPPHGGCEPRHAAGTVLGRVPCESFWKFDPDRGEYPIKVRLVDPRSMHEEVRPELEVAFSNVLERSSFIGGSYVETFEKDFAAYCGVPQAVACASGTDAVKMALMAAGVRAGEAVITASHTFIATVEAISMVGAHPIFTEIEPDTYHLSPMALQEYMLEKCRLGADGHWVDGGSGLPVTAVLPVHLYGLMADMKPILEVAQKYNLQVVKIAPRRPAQRLAPSGQRPPA